MALSSPICIVRGYNVLSCVAAARVYAHDVDVIFVAVRFSIPIDTAFAFVCRLLQAFPRGEFSQIISEFHVTSQAAGGISPDEFYITDPLPNLT